MVLYLINGQIQLNIHRYNKTQVHQTGRQSSGQTRVYKCFKSSCRCNLW